ncbi:BCCT family transporter [Streptomyces malaysiensis]|uniref:Uncharacterized protein n=1 Tax=Streptomyces malaysiensis TaxID=92644 RepID=A0A7X5WWQ6_STRMQ|nr:hypothetical protein [Streptomyces malaysiensis]
MVGACRIALGNAAFSVDARTGGELSAKVADDPAVSLFGPFGELPVSAATTALAVLPVAMYFVTSSDSASLVIDLLTAATPTCRRSSGSTGPSSKTTQAPSRHGRRTAPSCGAVPRSSHPRRRTVPIPPGLPWIPAHRP